MRDGHVLGVSDLTAAHPTTPPISPDDLAMTIYHALGIDSRSEVRDALGRPLPLAEGQLLHALSSTVGGTPLGVINRRG